MESFQHNFYAEHVTFPLRLSFHDLPDVKLHARAELVEGVWLTANFWLGERHSRVTAQIDDGPAREMARARRPVQAPNGPIRLPCSAR